jgi:transcriptional regulator with XRE-family HTH domain
MDTIGARIMYILEQKNVKKIRFAEALNVSPAFVTEMCAGRKLPSDRTIADICRVYNVNEDWLRDGIGEPFMQMSREDTIAAYVGKINGGKITDIEESIIKFMAETPVEEWETLASALRRFAETIKKPDTE